MPPAVGEDVSPIPLLPKVPARMFSCSELRPTSRSAVVGGIAVVPELVGRACWPAAWRRRTGCCCTRVKKEYHAIMVRAGAVRWARNKVNALGFVRVGTRFGIVGVRGPLVRARWGNAA